MAATTGREEPRMSLRSVNIAIVGCGYWGVNYVRVLSKLPAATLRGVCDKDGGRLNDIVRRFHVRYTWNDLHDVLADDLVEAVVVATPSSTHYQIVSECLAAGKHVLVEKPLALGIEEAARLVDAARTAGRCLMVAHTFLYNPGVQALKRYVEQESFGPIYYLLSRRTHLGLIRSDVNAIWDLVPHDASIFTHLLGMLPTTVSAVGGRFLHPTKDDVGFITLSYPGGIIGNIQASWIDSNKVREVVVVGGRQRIVFDDLNNLEKIKIFEKGVAISGDVDTFGEFQLMLRDGNIMSPKVETSEPLKNQCQHFVDCVTSGQEPLSGGRAGLDVVRMMAAIDRSLRGGGVPVPVE
jgi:predicted dehydrogenase